MHDRKYEPEWEVSFNAADPIDELAYTYYLFKRQEAQSSSPQEKQKRSSTPRTVGTRKRVRKPVPRSTNKETKNRHRYIGEQTGGWSETAK
jgi:hypothetical protein